MAERVVKKVMFAKGKHFISISYEEGTNSKVLESNGIYSERFAKKLKSLSENLQKYLKLEEGCDVRVSGITFGSEKKLAKINFLAIFNNAQFVSMSLNLRGEARINSLVDEIKICCDDYLGGDKAAV